MNYDLCNNLSLIATPYDEVPHICRGNNLTNESEQNVEEDWPMERVVSAVVPVFFGVIGLAGLLGNALVIVGKLMVRVGDMLHRLNNYSYAWFYKLTSFFLITVFDFSFVFLTV